MEERITVTALSARGLPRSLLLLAPSPLLEIHTRPGAPPAATTPACVRTTDPSWRPFRHVYTAPTTCGPLALGLVVRDAAAPAAPPLGRALFSVRTALLEGWFPLVRDGATPAQAAASAAEVYVRVLRVAYCARGYARCPLAAPLHNVPDDDGVTEASAEGELREVPPQPGFLFRVGELRVSVLVAGVPVKASELMVMLETEEQQLRGGETTPQRGSYVETSAGESNSFAREGEAEAESVGGSFENEDYDVRANSGNNHQAKVLQPSLHGVAKAASKAKATYKDHFVPPKEIQRLAQAASAYARALTKGSASTKEGTEDPDSDPHYQRTERLPISNEQGNESQPLTAQRDARGRAQEVVKLQGERPDVRVADECVAEVARSNVHAAMAAETTKGPNDAPDEQAICRSSATKTEKSEMHAPDGVSDGRPDETPANTGNGSDCAGESAKATDCKDGDSSDDDDGESHDDDEYDDNLGHDAPDASIGEGASAGLENTPSELRRREVDFGWFRFGLIHGSLPRMLHIQIQEKSLRLASRLSSLRDHTIRIPRLPAFSCNCSEKCNRHVFQLQLCGPGSPGAKITVHLRIIYRKRTPHAECDIVSSRFKEVFSDHDRMATSLQEKFPDAKGLQYLFVGGLFTQHYPTYFDHNIQFFEQKLKFPNVQTVDIHTEGSVARNAKIIKDAVTKAANGPKSVVLIGHSKGGVDVVSVLHQFPQAVPFIRGIISFQAPFGGTYLIDYVARRKLAVKAIAQIIEGVWKGDEDAIHDLGYSARLRAVGAVGTETVMYPIEKLEPTSHSKTVEYSRDSDREQVIRSDYLDAMGSVPVVAFASSASFDVLRIRNAADAAGVASMAPAAQIITQKTGFFCDGLVTPADARIPHADVVLLDDMMHTEPTLYVKGTRYPPGPLTAAGLLLLLEKEARISSRQASVD